MKHTALHLAVFGVLAGAALAAQAADVQIYGRVDAGFLYEHKKGEDTFTQKAGGRAHNRIGFNVVEDLGQRREGESLFGERFLHRQRPI